MVRRITGGRRLVCSVGCLDQDGIPTAVVWLAGPVHHHGPSVPRKVVSVLARHHVHHLDWLSIGGVSHRLRLAHPCPGIDHVVGIRGALIIHFPCVHCEPFIQLMRRKYVWKRWNNLDNSVSQYQIMTMAKI